MSAHVLAAIMAPAEGQGSIWPTIIMFGAIILIFYFLLWRPQRKQQQEHEELVENLEKGDRVVTLGGIVGEIIHIEGDELVLKTAGDTRIGLERNKIGRRVDGGAGEDEG